jgi:hypothetical protein
MVDLQGNCNTLVAMTWSKLNGLLEPSYTIRGTIAKTAIHFNGDSSQHKKVKLTEKAYQKHISELKKYDF